MRLAAYLRVSTDRQARDGYGLGAQRSEIRSWARAAGHRIVVWCADEGVSGANGIDTREGLYDAFDAVRTGSAEGVVFTSLDRLARQMTAQEAVLAQVWAAGARVFSLGDGGEVLEDDPEDPMRTAVRQMRGVFAQLERGLIRQRMSKGKKEKAAQGGYVGGAPRFGFVAVDKALVADAAEQATVARVVDLHDQGRSLRQIVKVLDAEGLRPKRGSWHPSSVARVLKRST